MKKEKRVLGFPIINSEMKSLFIAEGFDGVEQRGLSRRVEAKEYSHRAGTWQQIVFIDFDNRKRERNIRVHVMGE